MQVAKNWCDGESEKNSYFWMDKPGPDAVSSSAQ
jgi:hypothetical protein